MRPRHDIEFNDRARLKLIKALAVGRLAVRQVTGKVNQDDGSDPVYKSQVTFYPEQNGNETLFIIPA